MNGIDGGCMEWMEDEWSGYDVDGGWMVWMVVQWSEWNEWSGL